MSASLFIFAARKCIITIKNIIMAKKETIDLEVIKGMHPDCFNTPEDIANLGCDYCNGEVKKAIEYYNRASDEAYFKYGIKTILHS